MHVTAASAAQPTNLEPVPVSSTNQQSSTLEASPTTTESGSSSNSSCKNKKTIAAATSGKRQQKQQQQRQHGNLDDEVRELKILVLCSLLIDLFIENFFFSLLWVLVR
jgi:hypothetical protein